MSNLVKFSPFLSKSIFDDFFSDNNLFITKNTFSKPLTNILENKNEFKLELSVPGLNKEDIKIDIDSGVLKISSEKKVENSDDNYNRREFYYSSFSRSFSLPEDIDEENIVAEYNSGILNLTLPKLVKPKKLKTIEIR